MTQAITGDVRKHDSHVDDVKGVLLVLTPQVLKDSNFFLCLPMEAFFVAHHLKGDVFSRLMVVGLDHLTEAAFADDLKNFIPICNMIMRDVDV